MHISPDLFNSNLTFGSGRQDKHLQVDATRGFFTVPSGSSYGLTSAVNYLFSENGDAIAQSLQGRTVREINTFVINLVYALEKTESPTRSVPVQYEPLTTSEKIAFAGSCLMTLWGIAFMAGQRFPSSTLPVFSSGVTFAAGLDISLLARRIPSTLRHVIKTLRQRIRPSVSADVKNQIYNKIFDVIHPIIRKKQTRPNSIFNSRNSYQETMIRRGSELALTDRTWTTLKPAQSSHSLTTSKPLFRKFLKYKWHMEKDHYVFTHGQQLAASASMKLLSSIQRQLKPTSKYSTVLRLHSDLDLTDTQFNNVTHYFRKRFPLEKSTLTGNTERDELLSVSLNPWDHKLYESALHFWLNNSNVLRADISQTVLGLLPEPFQRLSSKTREEVAAKLQEASGLYASRVQNRDGQPPSIGMLYAICVPKILVDNPRTNPLYQSIVLGTPVDRNNPNAVVGVLKTLPIDNSNLQGRLLVSSLRPENGVEIRGFSPATKKNQKALRAITDSLATQIINEAYSRETLDQLVASNLGICLRSISTTLEAQTDIQRLAERANGDSKEHKHSNVGVDLGDSLEKIKQLIADIETLDQGDE